MLETLLRLLPVVLGIAVGVALRLLGVARSTDGEFVFRLVFSVCLPTLIFLSVSRVVVTPELALFAVAPLAFFAVGYLVGQLVGRTLAVTGGAVPVLVISCMVVNGSFALTFVQALFGADGVARIAVFDAVNAALTFTWASYTAARGNPGRAGGGGSRTRILRSPPLYGVIAGLVVNLAGAQVPAGVIDVAGPFAAATPVLISVGTGILLTLPGRAHLVRAGLVVGTRLGTGLLVGVTIVLLFGLQDVDSGVILLLAVAPVGYVTVTFAALEDLDVPLATAALGLSLAVSLLLSLVVAGLVVA